MKIEEHLARLLRPIFPAEMEIGQIDLKTDDLVYRVHAMHSRPIHISFAYDVCDDYRKDKSYRPTMDTFITAYLRARYAQYVDDGVAAPAIEWRVKPGDYAPGLVPPVRKDKRLTTTPR